MDIIYVDILKIILAMTLGGVLGIERRKSGKAAGLRTLSLVASGSCLAVLASLSLASGGTDRVIQGIITGIGFLGAGAIISHGQSISGLTTAASTWTTAIIGVTIAVGRYALAVVFTLLCIIVLEMTHTEDRIVETIEKSRARRNKLSK